MGSWGRRRLATIVIATALLSITLTGRDLAGCAAVAAGSQRATRQQAGSDRTEDGADGCDRYVAGERRDGLNMPAGRRYWIGTGMADTREAAQAEARDEAIEAGTDWVLQHLCGQDKLDRRCTFATGNLSLGHTEPARRPAPMSRFESCAVVTLPSEVASPSWAAPDAIPSMMEELAGKVVDELQRHALGDTVSYGGTWWHSDGCTAAAIGDALELDLLGGLGGAGVKVAPGGSLEAPELRLLLARRNGDLVLAAELQPTGCKAPRIPITGPSFPRDLLPGDREGECDQ